MGQKLRSNVYEATCPYFSSPVVVKFARFSWEIPLLEAEITAYEWVEGSQIGPDFLGHLIEEGRVIGFVIARIDNFRHATLEDLPLCLRALAKLHQLGVRHGDTNKHNFLIHEGGVTLIDFDNSSRIARLDELELELGGLDLRVHLESGARPYSLPGGHGSPGSEAGFFWSALVGTLRGVFCLAMAMSSIDLEGVTAVLGYEYDGATRFLTRPDPDNVPIRLTLHIEATCALFDIVIPIRYKDKTTSKTINVRVSPLSITSLAYSTKIDLPDAIKPILPSATCLELQLIEPVTILVPSFIKEPVAVARARSGKILNSLYELSHITNLRIYIPDSALSLDQLNSISTAIEQQQLQPFSGPDYDISRMFSGSGAKVTILPAPLPPSYDKVATLEPSAPLYSESATFDPPNTRSRKRKPSQEVLADADAVWNKLQKLEAMINHRTAQDAQASSQSLLAQELRAEMAQLREQLASCQKKCADLEMEIAGLREAQANADDAEAVELADVREDIKTLESRIDFVERGKDDEELGNKIKVEIFEELVARVKGG
ncbi:hypothetical protein FZEAL_10871 [Fusarium zealandicum]|uniref:Protein kinase domain-containing protein n=1 Tax=Fusarium zealandicum TaxID=1053134 RepID=A0A8H4TUT5_9HYPO|nr:hypothetical protein FZEAL_10871 [Fusarium zealandicum]